MTKYLSILFLASGWLSAQDPVSGQATISLVQSGTTCSGAVALVDVYVDITGLTGQGGEAGLNAFSLSMTYSDPDFAVLAYCTNDPIPFKFTFTDVHRIPNRGAMQLVGASGDTQAPNDRYHVATMWVGKKLGTVRVDLDPARTSLGSRRVGNAGPGSIAFTFAGALDVTINDSYTLLLGDALSSWRSNNPTYDFQSPTQRVDVLDLVTMTNCDGP